jgi:hypothetical protein
VESFGLTEEASEPVGVGGREVSEGASEAGEGDAVAGGSVLWSQLRAMELDAARSLPTASRGHGDVRPRGRVSLPDPPEGGGAEVAEKGAVAAGQDGRHPAAALGEARVADGVDPAVNQLEAAGSEPLRHRVTCEAGIEEL